MLNRHLLFSASIVISFMACVFANCESLTAQTQILPAIKIRPSGAAAQVQLGEINPQPATPDQPAPPEGAAAAAAAAAPAAPTPDPEAIKRKATKTKVLKTLSKVVLNRLPSNILKTWSDENQPAEEEVTDGLPPAPGEAILYDEKRFAAKLKEVQKHFTLGNWDELKNFMDLLPEANAKAFYLKIVSAMSSSSARKLPSNKRGGNKADPRAYQSPFISFDDAVSIVSISPTTIEKKEIGPFANLFNETIRQGNTTKDLMAILREKSAAAEIKLAKMEADEKAAEEKRKAELEAKKNEPVKEDDKNSEAEDSETEEVRKPVKPFFTRRNCSLLLLNAGRPIEAGEFLPEIETAKEENDHEALNLLSRHYLALHTRDDETELIEQAWHVTQAILESDEVDETERKQALARAVQLSTKVRDELGEKWLDETFNKDSEHGIQLVATVGSAVSQSMISLPTSPTERLKQIELQTKVVNELLKRETDLNDQWKHSLELMANNWLREAIVAYDLGEGSSLSPQMQRDSYGNIYYFDDYYRRQRQTVRRLSAINVSDVLENKPSDEWMQFVNSTMRPKFDMVLAQLYLKVQEEDLALPYLEQLAKPYPKQTEDLVKEFLRVWTANHDPNSATRRTNSYMYMYGYERRAESIPLTRSKQQRNLQDLSELIPKLQKLQEDPLEQELIAKAFFACHSTAEVYKIDELERVFGNFDEMQPKVVMNLAQRMRTNLATLWRDATVQKKSKTKRTKKDIQAEVLGGYAMAQGVLERAIKANPDEWTLMVANASLMHDENNYRRDQAKDASFAGNRNEALSQFKTAAEKYVSKLSDLEEKDYSTDAFTTWFYAGMGACDLGLINEDKINAPKEPSKIKAVFDSMPEKARDWHVGSFANLLFTRMSSAKPQIKHRYLDAGFEIVGDHKRAAEAKKVRDYYRDLVSEIKLTTEIDGDDRVGNGQPFGVYVNLKHTKEIERESGGFGRYLQNQNSNTNFSYNYGRPTNDYRDKFEDHIRQTYSEQFEIISVTFQKPDVKSVPDEKEGWRVTPYAYVLLKSRGEQVDKLPPVKLDLDFLDTSGYAILPIESPTLPIDCSTQTVRPAEELRVTQILDERQSEEGILMVEVKATARGLVPSIDKIVDVENDAFEIAEVEDQGVSISRFDEEADDNVVLSERSWMVRLEAKSGQTSLPKEFAFPKPTDSVVENVYQRYVDADLEMVESGVVALEEEYGEVSYTPQILTAAAIAGLLLLGFIAFWVFSRPRPDSRRDKYELAENASPFTVISMLQNIHRTNGLSNKQKKELGKSINRLESYYFGGESSRGREPNLKAEARKWSRMVKS